jgi:hypothetical protein
LPTTARLSAYNEDVLSDAFDTAPATSFWLPTLQDSQVWTGLVQGCETSIWDLYEVADPQRTETKIIQPAADTLQKSFPGDSPYIMKNTYNGWEKMTQDATLFMKNLPEVHTMVAALFKWVGQDESPFPSKRHKAKFVRDCARLYEKCGGHREVHGVISDLSRIVAVKFIGYDQEKNLLLEKTPVLAGDHVVRTMLTQFAFAQPCHLGFDHMSKAHWSFNNTNVVGGRVLGEGLHGSVFSVANEPWKFVKVFESVGDCEREVDSLRKLNEHDPAVPSVPRLLGVSDDRRAILASPVGSPVEDLRGRLLAWKVAAKFVVCLEKVHQVGLCHRDVRPLNMAYRNDDSGLEVVLFDWSASCDLESKPLFSGTLHYAAQEVLEILSDFGDPSALAKYDLESLVYSFWDITRDVLVRPRPITIPVDEVWLFRCAKKIQEAWEVEERTHLWLRRFLKHARDKDYDGLASAFENLSVS